MFKLASACLRDNAKPKKPKKTIFWEKLKKPKKPKKPIFLERPKPWQSLGSFPKDWFFGLFGFFGFFGFSPKIVFCFCLVLVLLLRHDFSRTGAFLVRRLCFPLLFA